jgi:DNA polymerase III, delta subunit
MIYLIVGTNAYRAQYELQQLVKALDVRPEKIDAASLDLNKLADTVRGLSLFQERRLIVIERLSERKDLWDKLGEWASDIAAETYLVLIEPRPDKRTKTFKTLQKTAKLIEATPLTDRQRPAAEKWLLDYASEHSVKLTKTQASDMVTRAIVDDEKSRSTEIDQLQLTHAVAALKNAVKIDDAAIATVLPPAREFSVFDIIELAVRGKTANLRSALDELRRSDDVYKVAPLVWSQWSQLVLLAKAEAVGASDTIDLGIHPFVAKRLRPLARQLSPKDLAELTELVAERDYQMKTSSVDPWAVLEDFLFRVALRQK